MSKTKVEQALLKELKKFGATSLSDDDSPCTVHEWLSTGCVALDSILGGGLPVGRITEIYGDMSTGKSLVAAQVVSYAQELDIPAVYIDTETAVSKEMMGVVGVDVDKLIYHSPDTVEEVFTLAEEAISVKSRVNPSGLLLLVWDSIAATSIRHEMDAEYGKATMGRHAALISQGLRKITRKLAKERVVFLALNQIRKKINVMYGDPTTTFGGKAVHFHSSIRVELKSGSKIKSKSKGIVGIETRAIVVKNKVAIPFREAKLPIYFGHGVDDDLASFLYMKDNGFLKSSGGWYTLELEQGDEKFQQRNWRDIYNKHYEEIADMILYGVDYEEYTDN